jgi:hypothetical protein
MSYGTFAEAICSGPDSPSKTRAKSLEYDPTELARTGIGRLASASHKTCVTKGPSHLATGEKRRNAVDPVRRLQSMAPLLAESPPDVDVGQWTPLSLLAVMSFRVLGERA